MQRTTIILPQQLRLKLRQEAQNKKQSFGMLVRTILERYVAARHSPFEKDSFFSSHTVFHDDAASDVALRHDEYLYGNKRPK